MLERIDELFGSVVGFLEKILFVKPMDIIGGVFSFPFIVLTLLVGAIVFTFYFKFINIRGFKHSIDIIRGKYDNPNDIGQISHFQALTSALSATIGLGNIAGVAVAVSTGGPGAVFWMMFIAIFSMSAKFVSATLGQIYRQVDKDGTINGGPMYYLSIGLKEKKMPFIGKILAGMYAVFIIGGAFGGGNMFQANQSFELVANRFTFFQVEEFEDVGNGEWDNGELFSDSNNNRVWDEWEDYNDCPNGRYDQGEKFTDIGDGEWIKGEYFEDQILNKPAPAEDFTDLNGNGEYDGDILQEYCDNNDDGIIKLFIDGSDVGHSTNGVYDKGEWFVNLCDGNYDEGIDKYIDINDNGKYDVPEPYIDSNNNGFYDYEISYVDQYGNGTYDGGEYYVDKNCNNEYDDGEEFDDTLDGEFSGNDQIVCNDKNVHYICGEGGYYNNIYDKGEDFTDIGNGKWDDKRWNSLWYGLLLIIIVGLVIVGGISRIAKVTEKIVPVMVVTYVAASLWIIGMNIGKLPSVISTIFGEAFSPDAMYGGFLGVLIIGVQRAVFSNEGGVGSASIAHSAAKTDEPVREGIVAMIGPFIDTIVICFMTASVILITADINPSYQPGAGVMNGASLTSDAFGSVISWFPWILAIVVFLFSYSTMISWYYYGDKGWKYLFGDSSIRIYQVIYLSCIMLGTIASLGNVITFSDLMILSCAVPNIIGSMFLLPKLKGKLDDYWERYKAGKFKTYK